MGGLVDAEGAANPWLPVISDGQLRVIALDHAVKLGVENAFATAPTPESIVASAQKFFDFLTKD